MTKKLFVAGLAYSITDEQLAELFSQVGTVESAKVIVDHMTGESKGFGFVEMSSENEAIEGITKLNETSVEGRTLMVKEARPKTESSNNSYGSKNNYSKGNGKDNRNRSGGRSW